MIKKIISFFIFNKFLLNIISRLILLYEVRIDEQKGELIKKRIKNKGKNCTIKGTIVIHQADFLKLGDGVGIGEGCFLHCMGGIEIGTNTQISRNVLIYSGNHDIDGKAIPYDENYKLKKVSIGHSVWIGMNVVITPGVTIGDGAVIGMGTVVSRDVPNGAIVVGSKQRVAKYRNITNFNSLKEQEKYFYKLGE